MTLPEGYGKTAIWRRFANGLGGHLVNALRRRGIGGRLRCRD